MTSFALKGFVLAGLVSLAPTVALADGEQQVDRGVHQEEKAHRDERKAERAEENGHPLKAAHLRHKASREEHRAHKNIRQGERREVHGD